jgi:hypothetical protein
MRQFTQHGNVIAADFRPGLDIRVQAEILYCDEHVYLARFTLLLDGKVISREHFSAAMPTA